MTSGPPGCRLLEVAREGCQCARTLFQDLGSPSPGRALVCLPSHLPCASGARPGPEFHRSVSGTPPPARILSCPVRHRVCSSAGEGRKSRSVHSPLPRWPQWRGVCVWGGFNRTSEGLGCSHAPTSQEAGPQDPSRRGREGQPGCPSLSGKSRRPSGRCLQARARGPSRVAADGSGHLGLA